MNMVKEFMEKGRLTQAEVGSIMGIDQSVVSKYVNGTREAPKERVATLVAYVTAKLQSEQSEVIINDNVDALEVYRSNTETGRNPFLLYWGTHSYWPAACPGPNGQTGRVRAAQPFPQGYQGAAAGPYGEPPKTWPPAGMVHLYDEVKGVWVQAVEETLIAEMLAWSKPLGITPMAYMPPITPWPSQVGSVFVGKTKK